MRFDTILGAGLSLAAVVALAGGAMAVPMPAVAAGPGGLVLPLCGDFSGLPGAPPARHDPSNDCPAGCHAMCSRRDELCHEE